MNVADVKRKVEFVLFPAPMTKRELHELASMDAKYMQHSWTISQWEDLGSCTDYLLGSLYLDKRLSGFILWKLIPVDSLAHLLKIVVREDCRGCGLGTFLLDQTKAYKDFLAYNFYLEVDADNERALRLYNSYGFKKIHFAKGFYGKERHAWIMIAKRKNP